MTLADAVVAATTGRGAVGDREHVRQFRCARAHHLRRWAIPRTDHPAGRAGYHRWRKALQALHADEAAAILAITLVPVLMGYFVRGA